MFSNMELKVRVDGIPRIICGVTENTTCQDVVIALAHAMGRTGTFTLIEKWRDNERPLNKSEFPVKVLQKWGEYANEVQLLLQQSDQVNKQSQQGSMKEQVKSKDNFKHSFSPPPQKEGPVRRSLTFSGAHNVALPAAKRKDQLKHSSKLQNISEKENLGETALTQSLPTYRFTDSSKQANDQQPPFPANPPPPPPHGTNYHPYSQVRKPSSNQSSSGTQSLYQSHHSLQQEQTTHHTNRMGDYTQQHTYSSPKSDLGNVYRHYNGDLSEHSHGSKGHVQNKYSARISASPVRKSPNKIASPVSPSDSRGQSPSLSLYNRGRQSAFSPVIPRQKSPSNQNSLPNGDLDFRVYSPENERPDVVEYDLDSNFPDIYSKQSHEEYHMPSEQIITDSSPVQDHSVEDNSEFVKMQELVTRQQERIKHQESQLEIIISEITALEKRDIEQAKQLLQLAEEKAHLEQKHKQFESELSKLESTKWVDLVQAERQAEAKIRSEMMEFKSRTTKVGSEIKNLNSKLTSLERDIENENVVLKEEKEKRELEEKKLQEEVEKVRIEIRTGTETSETEKQLIVKIENELKEMNEELDRKKDEAEQLEKELKDANMKEFKNVTPMGGDKGKIADSGEVVLKVLEGRKSPSLGMSRKMIASPLSKILSVQNPNGVWV